MAKKSIVCRRLKGLMVEKEMTLKDLSKKIGISENSLVQKINGYRDWWYWEMMYVSAQFEASDIKDVFPELHEAFLNKAI